MLQRGRLNVVLDLFWGSSGKGKICSWMARENPAAQLSVMCGPNSGHTIEIHGVREVLKHLPSGAVLGNRDVWISASSVLDMSRLDYEVKKFAPSLLQIHPRAAVITADSIVREKESVGAVGSTCSGNGQAIADKVMRGNWIVSAEQSPAAFSDRLHIALVTGSAFLHEMSQGTALSLDHGTHYPHCTSRNVTTAAALDGMGLSPQMCGEVYGIIRPYPIRVGSPKDGFSGEFEPWGKEITWEIVADRCGMPTPEFEKLLRYEHTTVTKRLRRVSEFSFPWLHQAVRLNGVTGLVLNFCQYIDWRAYKVRSKDQLPLQVRAFADRCEEETGAGVVGYGTGPDIDDMVWDG